MSFAVTSDQSRAVNAENCVKTLQRDIVNKHIICPLQKAGIYRDYRYKPLHRHACRHGNCLLLRDTHVEKPFGVFHGKLIKPCTGRHRCRYRDYVFIILGDPDEFIAENR